MNLTIYSTIKRNTIVRKMICVTFIACFLKTHFSDSFLHPTPQLLTDRNNAGIQGVGEQQDLF